MQRALTLQQPHLVEPAQPAQPRTGAHACRLHGRLHLFAALLLRPLRLSVHSHGERGSRSSMIHRWAYPIHPRSSVLANRRFVLSERSTDTEGEAPWLEGIVSVRWPSTARCMLHVLRAPLVHAFVAGAP
jgi:hypothetical protein